MLYLNALAISVAQDTTNLVPNWCFENKNYCPIDQIAEGNLHNWFYANTLTPAYFDSCSVDPNYDVPNNFNGFQNAYSGSSYVGICFYISGNRREYFEVKLINPLEANKNYCFELYYSMWEVSMFSTPSIQAYFAIDSIFQNDIYRINKTPQITNFNQINNDTLNWQRLTGNFISSGDEEYLILGNFNDDSSSNIQPVNWGISPGAYYYIDNVRLYDCTQPDTTIYSIEVFPNPNNGNFTVNYNLGENINSGSFKIYDAIGKLVYDEKLTQNNGTLNLNLLHASGIYLWEIWNEEKIIGSEKLIITR